jgi:2-desacetyl-2-hydroxyethyl bacteriochlorophyllide A dehydrogenase
VSAAVLHGPRDLRVEARGTGALGTDDVQVHVRLAGLCGTDVRIWSGDRPVRYPLVLGHEFLGTVEAVGSAVTRVRPGERIVVEPNYSCGACALCREGNRNLCRARTAVGIDVDGGFAEMARVPSRCCWPAPAAVAEDDLLLTEPLAVVARAVARGFSPHTETAAVLGVGTLGLLAIQVLRARGTRVLAVGRSNRRADLARRLGADATHAVADGDLEAAAQRFAGREGVDLVVETAGTAEAVDDALALVRAGGRVVLTGLPHAPSTVSFFSVVRREVTLTGSMIYQDEFGEALRLLASGAVQGAPLVTHRFRLADIADAFAAHRDRASIKVALIP